MFYVVRCTNVRTQFEPIRRKTLILPKAPIILLKPFLTYTFQGISTNSFKIDGCIVLYNKERETLRK